MKPEEITLGILLGLAVLSYLITFFHILKQAGDPHAKPTAAIHPANSVHAGFVTEGMDMRYLWAPEANRTPADREAVGVQAMCDPADPPHPLAEAWGLGRRAVFDAGYVVLNQFPGNPAIAVGNHTVVFPEHRGQGLGTEFHVARIMEAQRQGFDYILATVVNGNEPMQRIFRKVGWTRLAVFRSSLTGHDICLMGRPLTRESWRVGMRAKPTLDAVPVALVNGMVDEAEETETPEPPEGWGVIIV